MNTWFKYLRSFVVSDWKLLDYPIEVSKESCVDGEQWVAHILGSSLFGFGDSEEAARTDLQVVFDEFSQGATNIPRPGTDWPIVFGSSEGIERHAAIAHEFFPKIIGMKFEACFVVSDESCLSDFEINGNDEQEYLARIQSEYGLDVSDVENGNLVAIFERIAARGGVA